MAQQIRQEMGGPLADISTLTLVDMMSRDLLTVYEGWSIRRLVSFFAKHQVTGAPVVASDESLVGVVTQADVIRFESRTPSDAEIQKVVQFYYGPNTHGLNAADLQHLKDKAIETCTINSIMTPEVVATDVHTNAVEACRQMVRKDLHRLFVTEESRLVGVVTAMDFLRRMV